MAQALSAPLPTSTRALEPSPLPPSTRLYGWLCERALHPAWERLVRHRDTVDIKSYLERTQWLPPEVIESLQLAALRELLDYAGKRVPYYRELFASLRFDPRDVKSGRDLCVLPPLTKDIIRERYRDLVDPAHRGRNLEKGTSGSTGQPLKFEYSPESHEWREATKLRGYGWGGYHVGLPTFHYWAQVHETPQGMRGLKLRLDRTLKRDVFVDSMHQDEASRRAAVELFRATRPNVMVCYTQSCAQWARFILDKGLRDWPDTPVLCGAEAVLPADRAVLRRAFGPEIFETYGSRETMLIAAECEAHDGLHLSEENLLVEITRDGQPVPDGLEGDVLVTDLHNFGMPFIRYQNGDVAKMKEGRTCRCGRGLRRLDSVGGRRAETLTDARGEPVPGIVFHVLFSDSRREVLKQFQVIQEPDRNVVFRAVRGADWDPEAFTRIMRRFEGYLRGLPMRVEFCDAIPPGPNGKHRTVVVNPPLTAEANAHAR